MSDLPTSWLAAALHDIVLDPQQDIVDGPFGSNLKAGEYQDSGIPIIRLQNVARNRFLEKNIKFIAPEKANELQRHTFITGDIAITKLGNPLGKAAIIPPSLSRGVIVADIVRLRIDRRFADSRYLTYAINSPDVSDELAEETKGTTRPRVNLGHIRSLQIPLAPLNEQKRIADKLDAILARVDACHERLDHASGIFKRFRQSVLAAATSGKLTEEWRGRMKDRASWKATHLRDLSELITKGASPKWQGFSYVQPGEGVLFIRSENVREMRLDVAEPKYVESALNDAQKRSSLRKGDLLTNIVGASIGRTAIYDLSLPANINQAVCLVRLKDEVNGRFILYVLSSPSVIDYMHGEKVDVARANLSLEDIGNIPVNIPERDEQDEVVRRVETLFAHADHLEGHYTDVLAQVEGLTPALLAKAFRGELVPQDPSDEPAAVLLERIGALRAAAAKLPRPPKATQTNKEVRELMQKLLDVLEAAKEWLPAEEAFRRCGVSDGSQTDRLEELYAELRQLDKAGTLQVRRIGDFDELRLERKA